MKNTHTNHRVRFIDVISPSKVYPVSLPEDVSMEEHLICESCGSRLDVLCTLHSEKSRKSIRVGICDFCGYSGYIDRPQKQWIVDFYSKDWDQVSPRAVDDIRAHTTLQKGVIRGSMLSAFNLHTKLPTDKNKPVLEIGSGYGQVLKNFYDAGFLKVCGVENSKHRATLVHEAFGFDILQGDFGNRRLTDELKKRGPFGLVFSHHVLEHTYHPRDVIHAISLLQEEGDALILAVPNDAEHILYQTLYLPHLHNFTPESLEILLNKNGYEIMFNETEHVSSIIFGAIKQADPHPKLTRKVGYAKDKIERLSRTLKVEDVPVHAVYELYWEQKAEAMNHSRVVAIESPYTAFFMRVAWRIRSYYWFLKANILKRFRSGYNMRFQRLEDQVHSGIVIEYDDAIRMMMK